MNANGTPLGLTLMGANCHDSRMLTATLDAVPGVRTGRHRIKRGTGPTSCTPMRATTIAAADASAEPAASPRGSSNAASRAASCSVATAGSGTCGPP